MLILCIMMCVCVLYCAVMLIMDDCSRWRNLLETSWPLTAHFAIYYLCLLVLRLWSEWCRPQDRRVDESGSNILYWKILGCPKARNMLRTSIPRQPALQLGRIYRHGLEFSSESCGSGRSAVSSRNSADVTRPGKTLGMSCDTSVPKKPTGLSSHLRRLRGISANNDKNSALYHDELEWKPGMCLNLIRIILNESTGTWSLLGNFWEKWKHKDWKREIER